MTQHERGANMRYLLEFSSRPWRITLPVFLLLLVLAVACGTAAPAEPQTAADPAPQEPAATGSTGAAPTAAPTPASPLAVASTEVHPGKLTIMVGDLSNERFDPLFAVGGHGGQTYGKIVHGSLISTDERLRPLPGI